MTAYLSPLRVVVLVACVAAISCSRQASEESLNHFRDSILYVQQAIALEPSGTPLGTIGHDELEQIVRLKRLALEEAEAVEPKSLRVLHPEMPEHFEDRYLRGLRQHIEGYDSGDISLMNRGTLLINEWGNWYSAIQRESAGNPQPRGTAAAGPQSLDEVRQMMEAAADAWNEVGPQQEAACRPNRPFGELCVEQFNVEVAEGRLALLRHRRLRNHLDKEELAAFSRLMGDGWTDREEVCREPFLGLFRDFGLTVEFHYYSRDATPLFHHGVGWHECEEAAALRS